MRRAARVFGVVWMAACFVLWLWVGLIWDWSPYEQFPWLPDWTRLFGLTDTKMGATVLPIALGLIGYAAYSWGAPARNARPE